jgi:hypothetical protein
MADPLSIVTSAIAVMSAAAETSSLIANFIKKTGDARGDLTMTSCQLTSSNSFSMFLRATSTPTGRMGDATYPRNSKSSLVQY